MAKELLIRRDPKIVAIHFETESRVGILRYCWCYYRLHHPTPHVPAVRSAVPFAGAAESAADVRPRVLATVNHTHLARMRALCRLAAAALVCRPAVR